MSRSRVKKVLLVSPNVFPDELLCKYDCIRQIENTANLFPSLYELNPDVVILDYDYVGKDIEKIIRRIKLNKFYSKLKVCCYKSALNEKTDSLLKAIGLDQLIYKEDLSKPKKSKTAINSLSAIFEESLLRLATASRI
ncbi:MAG TPA: hypothetical protein VGI43_00710 [Mucilaginibacter sp.]|jgi:CheY-like chemotaxis protein